jgi:TfoX/Sxy family transcriptional regulator of competence genes
MVYDPELADRIRSAMQHETGTSEKRMFGGLAFLVNGNLAVSASGQGGLLLRVDPTESDDLEDGSAVTRAVMGGRTLDGWLRVAATAIDTDAQLRSWVARGVRYAASLPPK